MAHRLAPQARTELDDIWDYITREGGSAAAADSAIDSITDRFYLLGHIWAAPATTCDPACAAILPVTM